MKKLLDPYVHSGSPKVFEIDVKRFHVPGYSVKGRCPKCFMTTELDLDTDYLSFPQANKVFTTRVICNSCGEDLEVTLRIRISVEVVEK